MAAGLAFLHSMNPVVIHQDIKPDNIMIGDNGTYMITDFGVSAHAKSTLRKSMSIAFASAGTTAYMAPERFSKDNTPIKANDIYSLGATVYEMLTGDPPFGESGGLFQKRGAEIPNLPGNYSAQLSQLIEMCLQENPWDRPTAEQVEEYAQTYLDGGDPFPGPEPWYKKYKTPLILVASFVAAFAVIAAILLMKQKPIDEELVGIVKAAHLLRNEATTQEGLSLLSELSDEGDADATYLLSRLLFKSKSANDFCPDSIREMQHAGKIAVDNKKAHALLLKTIEQNPEEYHALYELGCDYLGGDARSDITERDIRKADGYYKSALKYAQSKGDSHYVELIQQQMEKYGDSLND